MNTFFSGFLLSLSLILPIGSQNAFVLKQGIKRNHVLIVCLVCAFSDAVLIGVGVAGLGTLVSTVPFIETVARYGGALFLFIYGLLSFKSAIFTQHALSTKDTAPITLRTTIALCLAFTWLNPHVYLDTVFLLGSVSTQYQGEQLLFALGAILASFVFFFTLGFGARALAPLFAKPAAWRVLEVCVGLIMWRIAYSLVA